METTWTTSNHQSDPSGIKLFIQIAFTSSSNTRTTTGMEVLSSNVWTQEPNPPKILKPLSDYSPLSKLWRSNDTTTNRPTISIQPEPREDHHGNTLPSSPKASHDQRHDTNNQERLEIGTCFASGMDTSRTGEQMTTTYLPPVGSVWMRVKNPHDIVIVKGYDTLAPTGHKPLTIVKIHKVNENTPTIEVLSMFTWHYKLLQQGEQQ